MSYCSSFRTLSCFFVCLFCLKYSTQPHSSSFGKRCGIRGCFKAVFGKSPPKTPQKTAPKNQVPKIAPPKKTHLSQKNCSLATDSPPLRILPNGDYLTLHQNQHSHQIIYWKNNHSQLIMQISIRFVSRIKSKIKKCSNELKQIFTLMANVAQV